MKKYQLYNEFNGIEIYGEDPIDAVNRRKSFPRPKHQEGEKVYGERMIANMVESPALIIKQALEIEDTTGSKRGSDEYITVIAECENGQIVAIDMKEIKMGRPSVGTSMLTAITVSDNTKAALEKKAKEVGVSVPDVRRAAYEAYLK